MNDVLNDALSNLEHDNYERSHKGYENRQADVAMIRAAMTAQPAASEEPREMDMDRARAEFIDDQGVADFAAAMRRKLEKKRAEGRGGWHDPDQCQLDTLAVMLLDHLEKGDPVDIGNFAMMLYNRGDGADGQPSVLGATFREWLYHQLKARDIVASNLQAALDKAAARIAELEGARPEPLEVRPAVIDTQNEEAVLAVLAWADSLADYPVADEMDYSQEQMMEDWDNEQTDKD